MPEPVGTLRSSAIGLFRYPLQRKFWSTKPGAVSTIAEPPGGSGMDRYSVLIFEVAGLEAVARIFGAPAADRFRQVLVETVQRHGNGDSVVAELPAVPQVMLVTPVDGEDAARLANLVVGDVDTLTCAGDAGGHVAVTYRIHRCSGPFPQSGAAALRLLNVR